jgi:hypothetical protein
VRLRAAGWLLPWALLWAAGCAPARAEGPGAQTIYRYKNDRGRTVFVNGLRRVPERYRAGARPVDLSHISLNRQLGNELRTEVDRQLERLEQRRQKQARVQRRTAGGAPCVPRVTAIGSPDAGWPRELWRRHGHLVLISAVLLALLIATPFVVRRVQPERWVRLLMFVLPLLGAAVLMGYAALNTSRAVRGARQSIQRCPPPAAADPLAREARESDREALLELRRALWQEQRPAP